MSRSTNRVLPLLLLFAVVLSGCISRVFSGSKSVEGEWALLSVVTPDAALAPAEGYAPRIRFDDGRVSGSDGCTRFTGTYGVAGGIVTFSNLATTRMACLPPAEALSEAVLRGLSGRATRSEFEGRTLRLISGSTTLVYRRA
ncbi:hypothetical protein BH20GEM2_BH20GEM2_06920 [soil metagenome]|jgi:heat shock protein HslJ